MKTSEFKSANTKPLADDGFTSILAKLAEGYIPPHEDGHAVEIKVPEPVIKIFNYIKTRANKDVCVTEEQQQAIADDIRNLAEKDGAINDITVLQGLVTLINSYRSECANCLNPVCEKRDPDFPVKAVQ
jgi:hypothetical protein